jgi:transposase-like protein
MFCAKFKTHVGAWHMNGNPRTAAFKKKIAIESLKGDRTVNKIAKEYGIHPVQVAQ